MFSCVLSGGVRGIESFIIRVEADLSEGMPVFELVGYLGSEVKEARERVRSAMFPMMGSVTASQILPMRGIVPARAVGMPRAFVRKTVKKVLMTTNAPPP